MLLSNHYLDLYDNRMRGKSDFNLFAVEVGSLYNALGQVIKQLVGLLNAGSNQKEKESEDQSQYAKQSDTESARQGNDPNHRKFKQRRLEVKGQKKKAAVEDIDYSSSQNRESSFDSLHQKIEQCRAKPITKPSLDAFMAVQSQQALRTKQVYRQNQKHNDKKQELWGVDCQMCKDFYGNLKDKKLLCKHTSRHRTNAPYQRIRNFSQQFDDL